MDILTINCEISSIPIKCSHCCFGPHSLNAMYVRWKKTTKMIWKRFEYGTFFECLIHTHTQYSEKIFVLNSDNWFGIYQVFPSFFPAVIVVAVYSLLFVVFRCYWNLCIFPPLLHLDHDIKYSIIIVAFTISWMRESRIKYLSQMIAWWWKNNNYTAN